MARRTIVADGEAWEVYPSGRVTVYGRDQFGLMFQALAELSDRQLHDLFRQSQPAWTAPEAAYGAR